MSNGNAIVTNGLPHSLQNSPVALSSAHFENINEENDNIISNSTPMSTIEDTSINTNNGSEQKKKRRKSSANIASMDGVVPLPDSPSISPTSSNVTKEQVPKKPAATKLERKSLLIQWHSHQMHKAHSHVMNVINNSNVLNI